MKMNFIFTESVRARGGTGVRASKAVRNGPAPNLTAPFSDKYNRDPHLAFSFSKEDS